MRGAVSMVPSREKTMQSIKAMPEDAYKKVAMYVISVQNPDAVASKKDVLDKVAFFEKKYSHAFEILGS